MRRDPPHQILHMLASGFSLHALALSRLHAPSVCLSNAPIPSFLPRHILYFKLPHTVALFGLSSSQRKNNKHLDCLLFFPSLSGLYFCFCLCSFPLPSFPSSFLYRSFVFNISCRFKQSQCSQSSHLLFFLLFSHMSQQMIGLNTSVLQGRSTTTTAGQRCLSGRNPKSGWRGIKHALFQPSPQTQIVLNYTPIL